MSTGFYNKVAKKFGGYHTGAKYIKEYPNGDPEAVFKEKLIEYGGKEITALDVGCADGRFTLSMSPYFQKIIAIDLSDGMLEVAKKHQAEQKIDNVNFELQDSHKTNFGNELYDIIYSRRGPSDFPESFRLLKPNGYFIEIGIGEKDCQEIKEIFGRGQNYGQWSESALEKDKTNLEKAGFKIIFAKDYLYNEYYASFDDLNLFLQGVPIFEDFDPKKDKKFLEEYVAKFQTEKGIRFPRHRTVVVAQKT